MSISSENHARVENDKGEAKAYQVRQVLQAIEKLKVNNDLRH